MPDDSEHDDARARARRIKLMAFDVDGVLSDGSLFYSDSGIEIKAFNTLDGLGLKMLQQAGIRVAIITGRRARCVELRAQDLGIQHLYQAVDNKLDCMRSLLAELGLAADDAGYMGDDVLDLPVMTACAFSATPGNGHALVQHYATLTTARHGGRGAVREACEFILDAQDKLAAALAPYLTMTSR
ncbi:MAG: 3-deoxy-D-manno-octulosonate 8-phosphate phosphatase KdsC [Candidatus Accumulibacter phosphatis]|uniref:3-deoxy-D-manno-octulosonate 8-phosphate phosphatase KdsC n=1 Tax=Candidatus Accumulibacter phosphatis TaxID=327160 RepID=A0A080M409_9PROT|nr:3-deoxy-D-manno-octulosonate 8-phosphate phosphatase [Accumulibacter sp.]KFB71844.1 MAG: 3-deoxy-D-manno-octulosonate 8-phosphate phosphatase KdsC [Candidatus Accumulibacter phosphatis]MBL8407391.1 phenylphosphate carboxylase subunit delta [Accumulibacter sp.]HRF11207.1 phenylphosphate carboxylase subunit delta [Candidatus Accumulibacter phosphatis]